MHMTRFALSRRAPRASPKAADIRLAAAIRPRHAMQARSNASMQSGAAQGCFRDASLKEGLASCYRQPAALGDKERAAALRGDLVHQPQRPYSSSESLQLLYLPRAARLKKKLAGAVVGRVRHSHARMHAAHQKPRP